MIKVIDNFDHSSFRGYATIKNNRLVLDIGGFDEDIHEIMPSYRVYEDGVVEIMGFSVVTKANSHESK